MTDQRPADEARVRFVNATDTAVDLYVNYRDDPTFTGLGPLALGPVLAVGSPDRPFGTYTFGVRPAGTPTGRVLTSVSVDLTAGEAYHACVHEAEGAYHFAVYAADFSPAAEGHVEVRHLASAAAFDWELVGAAGTAVDGSLDRCAYQQAVELPADEYDLTVAVDGATVLRETVVHERGERTVVFVAGDLSATGRAAARVLTDELAVPAGGNAGGTAVTTGTAPVAVSDQNRQVRFETTEAKAIAGHEARVPFTVVDPDGVVTDVGVESVRPAGVTLAVATDDAGDDGTFAGELVVGADGEPGSYNARLVANDESLAERAVKDVLVDVRSLGDFRGVVEDCVAADGIRPPVADDLLGHVGDVENAVGSGKLVPAQETLRTVAALVRDRAGAEVDAGAATAVEEEARRLERFLAYCVDSDGATSGTRGNSPAAGKGGTGGGNPNRGGRGKGKGR
jgi:hypothetical protein